MGWTTTRILRRNELIIIILCAVAAGIKRLAPALPQPIGAILHHLVRDGEGGLAVVVSTQTARVKAEEAPAAVLTLLIFLGGDSLSKQTNLPAGGESLSCCGTSV